MVSEIVQDVVKRVEEEVAASVIRKSVVPERFVLELSERLGEDVQVMIGGSWAKNTYLPQDHDVDVFARFPQGVSDAVMSERLEKALSSLGAPVRIKGSRDYFQLESEGFVFEVVPVLFINNPSEAQNVTDASPLHVEYVLGEIEKNPSLPLQIRLAKLFLKSTRVYGAESYVFGFSGHVTDLLLIHHGSFIGFVSAAARWKSNVFIDVTGAHKSAEFLNPAKRAGPLVLLDPLQPARNAAAALKKESFLLLVQCAQEFLRAPDESFFRVRPLSKEEVVEKYPDKPLLFYELYPVTGKSKDVAGTKLYKAHEHIVSRARSVGFEVVDEGFFFDGSCAYAFVVAEHEPLSEEVVVRGPPVKMKQDVERFRAAHKDAYEQEGWWFVCSKREFLTLEELYSSVAHEAYVASRLSRTKPL